MKTPVLIALCSAAVFAACGGSEAPKPAPKPKPDSSHVKPCPKHGEDSRAKCKHGEK